MVTHRGALWLPIEERCRACLRGGLDRACCASACWFCLKCGSFLQSMSECNRGISHQGCSFLYRGTPRCCLYALRRTHML